MDLEDRDGPLTVRPDNAATRAPALGGLPVMPAWALDEAFAFACRRFEKVPAVRSGYRLFWVFQSDVGWMDLPTNGPYAIIGRHTECDIVLPHDSEISLRHLLASTVSLADGAALRVLDLQTRIPFYLGDDQPRRSIVASGPLAMRLGRYVVGAVPVSKDGIAECQLPDAVIMDSVVAPSLTRPPDSQGTPISARKTGSTPPPRGATSPDRSEGDGPSSISYITSLPRSRHVTEPLALAGHPYRDAIPPNAAGEVTLSRQGYEVTVRITREELDAGVLIGRSDRCLDRGLQAVLDTNISRGHILLLQTHGRYEAFDLCSTQGTFRGSSPMRRVPLEEPEESLRLGACNPVRMVWRRLRG